MSGCIGCTINKSYIYEKERKETNRRATVIMFPVLADPRDDPRLFGSPAFPFILLSWPFIHFSLCCYSSEKKLHTVYPLTYSTTLQFLSFSLFKAQ